MNSIHVSRRRLLGAGAASIVAAPWGPTASAQATKPVSCRVAHLTDLHHQERGNSLKGIEACLEHVVGQNPDLLLIGGDLMTGTMSQPLDVAQRFMGQVSNLLKSVPKPAAYAIGNHDIWGWNKERSQATGDEPQYGKKWWSDTFEKPRYAKMAIDRVNWQLITLDSVQPFEDGYEGGLDDAQFAWLEDQLKSIPATTPVLLLTHIPIIGAGLVLTDGRIPETKAREDAVRVPRPSMFIDAWRVVDLFSRHPNVKLVLSGHIHLNERIEFAGVTHICGGAVSGSWWRSQDADAQRRRERDPQGPIRPLRSACGYGIVDLLADGSFDYSYINFGWKIDD